MKLYVSEYNIDQGKSYTTIYYITGLSLDVDSSELTVEATSADGETRNFEYKLVRR